MNFRIIKNQSAKSKTLFQKLLQVVKNGVFYGKTYIKRLKTPLWSILIFVFNSNENQNYFKNSKISKLRRKMQRRNEDTKNDATMQRRYEEQGEKRYEY